MKLWRVPVRRALDGSELSVYLYCVCVNFGCVSAYMHVVGCERLCVFAAVLCRSITSARDGFPIPEFYLCPKCFYLCPKCSKSQLPVVASVSYCLLSVCVPSLFTSDNSCSLSLTRTIHSIHRALCIYIYIYTTIQLYNYTTIHL